MRARNIAGLIALAALVSGGCDDGAGSKGVLETHEPESAASPAIRLAADPAPAIDPRNKAALRGKRAFLQCASCHSLSAEQAGKIGPSLMTVYGRKAGSLAGYEYSEALAGADFVWSNAELDRLIADPSAFIPGTKMAYAGLPDPERRGDIIAYLKAIGEAAKQ